MTATATPQELEELVALQRFHARHGFGGNPPADITRLRTTRRRHAYLSGETAPRLVAEAIQVWRELSDSWPPCHPALKKLARERGVHNVPKLLDARAKLAKEVRK